MLIVDDILLFPGRSILWILREVYNAAQQEVASEAELIKTQLRELYMMLETGRISEEEFETLEKALLDRLDQLEEEGVGSDEEVEGAPEDCKGHT